MRRMLYPFELHSRFEIWEPQNELEHRTGFEPVSQRWQRCVFDLLDERCKMNFFVPFVAKKSTYKTDEGRERHCREHTSRHTSPDDGELADSPKAPSSSSVKAPCLHPAKRNFDCQKTKGAGFNFPGEAARSFNSLDLLLRLGAGVRSR